MKLILFTLTTVLFMPFSEAALDGIALRTSASYNTFSKCAVQEALGASDAFAFTSLLYAQILDGTSPSKISYLFFSVKTLSGSTQVLRLTFITQDSEGWKLIQGENGEIYPFARTVDSKALLVSPKTGSVLGARDISRCLNGRG